MSPVAAARAITAHCSAPKGRAAAIGASSNKCCCYPRAPAPVLRHRRQPILYISFIVRATRQFFVHLRVFVALWWLFKQPLRR